MPRKSRRSRAAVQRHLQRNQHVQNKNQCGQVLQVIKGSFHQGDLRLFSAQSAGRQCSCNSLVMLCTVENIFDTLSPCHLDEVLQIGDQLYKTRCRELKAENTLHSSCILDQTQLPNEFPIDECSYTVDYKQEHLRHGRLDNDPLQAEFNTWLQYAFTISEKNILILDGYMMALYKHTDTGKFMFFDSHSRNENG